MNASSSIPPMPTTSVSIEKYAGQVASSPARFALVPSSPSCAARPGSRTIHMNSAMPSGPNASTASVAHVTLQRRSLRNSVASTCPNIMHAALDEAPLLRVMPLARAREEVALQIQREQRLLALFRGVGVGREGARLRGELVARRLLDQAALVHDADTVGEVRDLGEDVARHEDGDAALVGERAQQLADLDDAGRVERVGGLVEHEQLGGVQQRAGEREALLVAERELPGAPVGVRLEPQQLDRVGDRPAAASR